MTANEAAAQFFVENGSIDSALTTTDGNAFLVADLNRATAHAAKQGLAAPATKLRSALTTEIALATKQALQRTALIEAHQLVDTENALAHATAAAAVTDTTLSFSARIDALATDLDAAALTNIPSSLTVDGVTLTRKEAVAVAWKRSGLSKAAWLALSQAARETHVTTHFSSLIP